MAGDAYRLRWRAVLLIALVIGTAACGSAVAPVPSTSSTATTGDPTTTTTGTATAGNPDPARIGPFTEVDNGRTIDATAGQVVSVTLHSTYWIVDPLQDRSVIDPVTGPTVTPAFQGCVPGQGCGSVSIDYSVVGPGSATIMARRTSCGEAMRCSPAESTWTLTIAAK